MISPSHLSRRSRFGVGALLALSFFAGCVLLGEVSDEYTLLDDGSTAGAGGTAGVGGAGGAGGAGGGTVFLPGMLSGPCDDMVACEKDQGECCEDDACTNTCAIPCNNINQCPNDTDWVCEHSYCLRACKKDTDCKQPGFNCRHKCTLCESKETEGC